MATQIIIGVVSPEEEFMSYAGVDNVSVITFCQKWGTKVQCRNFNLFTLSCQSHPHHYSSCIQCQFSPTQLSSSTYRTLIYKSKLKKKYVCNIYKVLYARFRYKNTNYSYYLHTSVLTMWRTPSLVLI